MYKVSYLEKRRIIRYIKSDRITILSYDFLPQKLSHTEQMMSVTSSQAPRRCEGRARLCSPQVQEQELSLTSNPPPLYSDECHVRSRPPQAQEQVWLPLQPRWIYDI